MEPENAAIYRKLFGSTGELSLDGVVFRRSNGAILAAVQPKSKA